MDTLSTILDAVWVNGMNLSHKKCVKALVRALLTLSVNLLKLARAAFSDVRPLSTVRRIERLLAAGIFNVTLLGRAIVNALPSRKRYILTMDRTTWELGRRVYNILAIGICYDGEESLLILATPAESGFTDRIYRLRWQIETSFRAMKTVGFNMEQTHLPLDGRFQNMLALILIAYACAFIDGLVRIRQRPIPVMKVNGRKRFSIFTWGLNIIAADIWQHLIVNESGACVRGT